MYFFISDDIHLISHDQENPQDQSFKNRSMIIAKYCLKPGNYRNYELWLIFGNMDHG